MKDRVEHVSFQNSQLPGSAFDLVPIERVIKRKYADHSPEDHHLVEFFILMIITSGKGKHTVDFQEHHLSKGSVLTIRKDQIHRFHRGTNLKGYVLLFKEEFLISYLDRSEVLRSLQIFNELLSHPLSNVTGSKQKELFESLLRIETEYFKTRDLHSLVLVRSELHILLTRLLRLRSDHTPQKSNRKYLSDFLRLQKLAEEKVHQTLKVKDYADEMATSTKTLNAITRSIVDKTAKEFIDSIAVLHIKRLLINTDHSIKEIAFMSGFEENTNFYKYFKRLTGITPEEFRQGVD